MAAYFGAIPTSLQWLHETTGPDSSIAVFADISTSEKTGKVDYKCMANYAFQNYVQTPAEMVEEYKRGSCAFLDANEMEVMTALYLRGSGMLGTMAPNYLGDGSTWKSVQFDFETCGLKSLGAGFFQMTSACYNDGKTVHASFCGFKLRNTNAVVVPGKSGQEVGIPEVSSGSAAPCTQFDQADLFMEPGEPLFLSRTEESELWGSAV